MSRRISIALFFWLAFLEQSFGQDVFVPRELKAVAVKSPAVKEPRVLKAEPVIEPAPKVASTAVKTAPPKQQPTSATTAKSQAAKPKDEPASAETTKTKVTKTETAPPPAVKKAPAKDEPAAAETTKTKVAKTETAAPSMKKTPAKEEPATAETAKPKLAKTETPTPPSEKKTPAKEEPVAAENAKPKVAKVETATPPAAKKIPAKDEPAAADTKKTKVAKTETTTPTSKTTAIKEHSETASAKTQAAKVEVVAAPTVKTSTPKKEPAANPTVELAKAETATPPAPKTAPAKEQHSGPVAPTKTQVAKIEPVKAPTTKPAHANVAATKITLAKLEPLKDPELPTKSPPPPAQGPSVKGAPPKVEAPQEPIVNVQLPSGPMETAFTKLADGFDFPVGKPESEGYYKARGFRSGGHMGEDWDGIRGGDTDFKDPIYCIGDGIVVFARDVHLGWGNVVIVRHAYRESGTIKHIDSLYGHLHSILVSRGQRVARGQQVGTMGTAHGQYDAHLHLEIRKNLEIGMSRSKFQKNLSNYYDPSQFIASHRHLSGGGANFRVAMNTFTHDSAYHFDTQRDFSARKRSTAQSSAALKRAVSSTTR
jgi:murein DD-endopeptidase MepM/ murein hydrolase activator NlpD